MLRVKRGRRSAAKASRTACSCDSREVLEQMLGFYGAIVTTVSTASDALAIAPDTDIGHPRPIPVVLVSGFHEHQVARLAAAPFARKLLKPIEPERLCEEITLSRRGDELARRRRRAPHVLPIPQGPVEDATDDEHDRTAPRGIPPAREDARLAANRRHRRRLALRFGRERPSQVAQNRRLAEDRRGAQPARGGGGMTITRAAPMSLSGWEPS
jgi:hypothetical protein